MRRSSHRRRQGHLPRQSCSRCVRAAWILSTPSTPTPWSPAACPGLRTCHKVLLRSTSDGSTADMKGCLLWSCSRGHKGNIEDACCHMHAQATPKFMCHETFVIGGPEHTGARASTAMLLRCHGLDLSLIHGIAWHSNLLVWLDCTCPYCVSAINKKQRFVMMQ